MRNKMAGSGFIIYRKFDDGIKFLGLVGPDFHRIRCHGTYDIPKGTIDLGETPYQTAVREAKEEAGYDIHESNVFSKYWTNGYLTIWAAKVDSDPVILPNPNNGITEHEGYKWMHPEDLILNCYDYLRPGIKWAIKEIPNFEY
jgi:8-oxo-dGTP pyrophosphatase MutT (NUDIX family)